MRTIAASIIAPTDFRAAQRKSASDRSFSCHELALLEKTSLKVHRNDEMYVPLDARHYLSTGLGALRCIESALQRTAGRRPVQSILDFPCGYGRVLSFLERGWDNHQDVYIGELA